MSKRKEHKSIIVRTRKGNTVSCYHFTTIGRNNGLPSGCNYFATFDKIAEIIDVIWNVGGDVFVLLCNTHPNGFVVKETVVFDKEFVTSIEIETDFEELRKD